MGVPSFPVPVFQFHFYSFLFFFTLVSFRFRSSRRSIANLGLRSIPFWQARRDGSASFKVDSGPEPVQGENWQSSSKDWPDLKRFSGGSRERRSPPPRFFETRFFLPPLTILAAERERERERLRERKENLNE